LRNSIERIEKLIAAKQHEQIAKAIAESEGPKEQGPNLEEIVRRLRNGAVPAKIQAAAELGKIRDGAPFLCYSLLTEPEISVREQDVTSLGNLGHAIGNEGVACLKKALNVQEIVSAQDGKQEVQRQMREVDLKRKIKEVLQRLGH
jgi:hypothetical protein